MGATAAADRTVLFLTAFGFGYAAYFFNMFGFYCQRLHRLARTLPVVMLIRTLPLS